MNYNFDCHGSRQNPEQAGFILPFVLLTIAAISLIALSSYNALSRSSEYMRTLQQDSLAQKAFASAEAETVYTFLTSVGEQGAMTAPSANSVASILGGGTNEPGDPRTRWAANGAIRRSDSHGLNVLVSYRDITGFIPINAFDEEDLLKTFQLAGFVRDDAEKLTAEFLDYTDSDNARIFRGAERSDYRLYNKPPPTNSPIRNITEISKLLSMPEGLGNDYWDNFAFITVMRAQRSTVQPAFAIPAIRDAFQPDDIFGSVDILDQMALQNQQPLNQARFLLTIPGNIPLSRAIEIEKRVNDVQKPFRRTLITERAGIDGKKLFSRIDNIRTDVQESDGDNEGDNNGGSDNGTLENAGETELDSQDLTSPNGASDGRQSEVANNAPESVSANDNQRGGVNEYPRIFTTRP